jgi:hypothetical protein
MRRIPPNGIMIMVSTFRKNVGRQVGRSCHVLGGRRERGHRPPLLGAYAYFLSCCDERRDDSGNHNKNQALVH